MRVCREEVFGPVLAVMTYNSEGEAIRIANDSIYGLAGLVMTRNGARGSNVARRSEPAPSWCRWWHPVSISKPIRVVARAPAGSLPARGMFNGGGPFGGFKQSGLGREQGRWGFEEYTELKSITMM